ncbi:hypothetical protein HD806DRAFT_534066 [Xylariaceae sp. AK1471]|nr:hypothetical protein HD806DRAFT_534066 [Xylariaceae sp. AK1471]
MPVLKSLPPWPDPQESIGRQITSSRVGKRKVWWPRGPALEAFEKIIQPEINHNLRGLDLGHAELFITLYMIGRKPENANPIVMVCCTDNKAREAVEATIRENGLLIEHKGFGLGAAALPLEHPTPVRRLSPKNRNSSFSSSGSQPLPPLTANSPFQLPFRSRRGPHEGEVASEESPLLIIDALGNSSGPGSSNPALLVFASSGEPQLGRRIFFSGHGDRDSFQYATAGVVIEVGRTYYQMTVGHLFEPESHEFAIDSSAMNLNECHFDGESDDEEHDSDYDSEITGRGSATPEDALSWDGSSSDSTSEKAPDSRNTDVPRDFYGKLNTQSRWAEELPSQGSHKSVFTRIAIGYLSQGISSRSSLDYALIALPSDSIERMDQHINRSTVKLLAQVSGVAEVGPEEHNIILITSSTTILGVLLPGKVAYRSHQNRQFENLAQVDLESEVFEGDCGSPVLDKSTGSLYGHLIMGVTGTKVAYIVQAVDIFRDIEAITGKLVSLATTEHVMEMPASTSRSHIKLSRSQLPTGLEDNQSSYSGSSALSSADSRSRGSSVFSRSSAASTLTSMSRPDVDLCHSAVAAGALPCEFVGYGSCDRTFALDEVEPWIEHIVTEHLKDHLPRKAICWFCDDYTFDSKSVGNNRRTNFDNRMWHIHDHILNDIRTIHNAYHTTRRYDEFPQGPWIIPYTAIPEDSEVREARQGVEYNNPHDEERKYRRHRHRAGRSRK